LVWLGTSATNVSQYTYSGPSVETPEEGENERKKAINLYAHNNLIYNISNRITLCKHTRQWRRTCSRAPDELEYVHACQQQSFPLHYIML